MKNYRSIALVILLLTTTFTNYALADDVDESSSLEYFGEGYRYDVQGWAYIHIEGEPYERGYQYGYLASEEIADIIYRWCQWGYENRIKSIINIKNEENIWELYKKHSKDLFLDKIPEEYIKEMEGIANGINSKGTKLFDEEVKFEDILALQLFQDVYNSCYKYKSKRFHPVRGFISGIKNFISKILGSTEGEHCVAFIATGDATKNGEVVVAHSTLFNPLIAEKCNIILDNNPTNGHRFMMTTYPGAIWSCEDYYQNEKGIVLTETELAQGPWTKKGVPKGVRSRNAIQYSDNIDEAIEYLMDGNNGLIPNEWLIGDTKTGEIASLEQALYNTPIKRTFDGFYWSCNIPHNSKVKRELYGISSIFLDISMKFMSNVVSFSKVNKFEEIKDELYGEIDVENAKKILAIDPLSSGLTDGKITTSDLVEDMVLLSHLGNPDGSTWVPTQNFRNKYSLANVFPAMGWVEIDPTEIVPQSVQPSDSIDDIVPENKEDEINFESIITLFILGILFLTLLILYFKYLKRGNKK